MTASVADQIVLASLANLGSNPDFFSGQAALRTAASTLGRADYRDDIDEAFAKHGIWGASISGPSQVQLYQSYTWTASVTGNTSAFTYKWYGLYSSGWSQFPNATGPTFSTTFYSTPIPSKIRATITRGSRTVNTVPISLTLVGGGGYKVAEAPVEGNALDATSETLPTQYALDQNYPNPFNPSTEIRFALPEATDVRLIVYDALGREVARLANGPMGAGYQHVRSTLRACPRASTSTAWRRAASHRRTGWC